MSPNTELRENDYSIIYFNQLETNKRIDSEYYDPVYLKNLEKIKNRNSFLLGDASISELITDGDHGNPQYEEKGIPYIKVDQLNDIDLDLSNAKNISYNYANTQSPKNFVNPEEVLISIKGTIGKVSIVLDDVKAVLNRDIAKIKLKESSIISSYYLLSFLKTKHANLLMQQISSGGLQKGFYLNNIKQLVIPVPSNNFQEKIKTLILNSKKEDKKADNLIKKAEDLLRSELRFNELENEQKICSIKNLSEIHNVDRLDSEYWDPKYEQIEDTIKNYYNGYDNLDEVVTVSKKKINLNPEEVYNYIELADIDSNRGLIKITQPIKGSELPSRARMFVEKDDVLISSIAGSIDKIALINFEQKNLVASTGFFVFKENKLNKENILVLLKILSDIYIKRQAQGTILTAIPNKSLHRIFLPIITHRIQTKISSIINQSHESRNKSKNLLKIAKNSVEIFIEKGENEGISYLKQFE